MKPQLASETMRPRIQALSEEGIRALHNATLEILEKTGVEMHDAQGAALFTRCFDPVVIAFGGEADSIVPWGYLLPYAADTRRIVLQYQGQVLDSRQVSPHPPQVTLEGREPHGRLAVRQTARRIREVEIGRSCRLVGVGVGCVLVETPIERP